MILHVTGKNWFIWIALICSLAIAVIGVAIPSEHWGVPPWKWVIPALFLLAVAAFTAQLLIQSKEDHEREETERKRDDRQIGMEQKLTQLTQLVSAATTHSGSTSLQPINPPVDFDAQKFFQIAYQSAATADVEKRIKIAAAQNAAHFTPEEFYSKFIAVGLMSYFHDVAWAYIWKSQFLMLEELNRQNGYLSLKGAKHFYDQGVINYPSHYTNYSFDQWLNFMQAFSLLIRHPTDMLEITVRRRDFLSYSAHNSRNANERFG